MVDLIPFNQFKNMPGVEFIVQDVLQVGGNTMIYAEEGTGKSFLGLEMAYCVANGESWLGFSTKKRPVVFVAAERWNVQVERSRVYPDSENLWFVKDAVDLSDQSETRAFLDKMKLSELVEPVVIFDTFEACGSLGDQRDVLASYEILREANVAAVLIHHPRKLMPGTSMQDPERSIPKPHGPSPILNPQDVRMFYKAEKGGGRILSFQKNNLCTEWSDPILVRIENGRPVRKNIAHQSIQVKV